MLPSLQTEIQRRRSSSSTSYIPVTLHEKQQEFYDYDGPDGLFGGAAGGGKLLTLDTPLATPSGWSSMGDIRVGDQIFGRDGKPYDVIYISPVEREPGWRLKFDDGSELVAHDEHLWLTFDAKELAALSRRTPEFRARRREARPSRAKEILTNPAVSAAVIERNRVSNPAVTKPLPTGTVRTTEEIVSTLLTPGGRTNHAIPVAASLELPDRRLPLDPYVLGIWLGDGTSSTGAVTSMDPEVVAAIEAAGFPLRRTSSQKNNRSSTYFFDGLTAALRALGVIRNKHVPAAYLWASERQRLALLQGLMDTDGTASKGGACEFDNTNLRLADAVAFLVRSLGHKATVASKRATLYGKDCGTCYRVKWKSRVIPFRLLRKAARVKPATRRTTRFRYLVGAERVEPQPMRCISVAAPDRLYLAGESMVPTHNTIGQLASALKYVRVPNYSALLIRRAYTHLQQPGAFIPTSRAWLLGTDATYNQSQHTWFFPDNARLTFGYLDNVRDLDRYQGGEYQYIGVDEATQIPENLLRYLYSRLRKKEGMQVPLRMRLTANPGGVSHEYIKRRYITEGEKHGRVFIPSLLSDNPSLDREEYLKQLAELDPLTRARLLNGDWDAMPEGGLFKRHWFKVIQANDVPSSIRWVRYWDMAATEPKEGTDPDWTAGGLVGLHDGVWYVRDVRRFRESPEGNERRIVETAFADGRQTEIVMEQEPGASGKSVIAYYARRVLTGFRFRGERSSGSKVERAAPLASAAEAGNLRLVEGTWIQDFLDEATAFPMGGHDDQVDAVSGAFGIINSRLRTVRSIRVTDL